MRWDRFTVAPRRLRLLTAVVTAVLVVGALLGARAATPAAPAVQVASTASPDTGGDRSGTDDRPRADEDLSAAEHAQEPAPEDPGDVEEEAAAWQVAADFAAGYATHRFDDGPSSTVERVRPFVTDELAAQLREGSTAAAATAERAARQEVAVAEVQAVQPQTGTVATGRLEVLVVVRQDVTWDGGSQVYWPTYLVEVRHGENGWRVSQLLP